VLAGLGLWLGPWLMRDRSAALIALGAAGAGVALIAPPTMSWLHAVSGLGHPLRRLFWAPPAPALTGLLASIRLPLGLPVPARRIAAQMLPLVLVAALVVGGAPSWGGRYSRLESAPTWKTDPV